jgi:tRNA(Phe) wybutosine-synthesizing methylase Tyw3
MVIIDTLLSDDEEIAEFQQAYEKLRDPTHVHAYTRKEWETMVSEAGFILHETKLLKKNHDFQEWAKRAGMNRTGIQALNKLFIEASDKIQDLFEVETFAGEVENFTDFKILIYASRPAKKTPGASS